MVDRDGVPRRRDVLRTGLAVGFAGLAGLSADGVFAQTTNQDQTFLFSHNFERGDSFRLVSRVQSAEGEPLTETIPEDCLDNADSEEYQLYIVDSYRGALNIGYRGLLVPEDAIATETTETTTETTTPEGTETTTPKGTETTTPKGTETTTPEGTETTTPEGTETTTPEGTETTTPEGTETTTTEDVTLQFGEWYQATTSEACDDLFRLTVEPVQAPEAATEP